MLHYTKPDIVCGTESWLNENVKSSEIFPCEDYEVFRKDRDSINNGGGVFTLVRKNLIALEMTDLDTNCEILWVKIKLKRAKDLLVSTFYMPHRDINTITEFESSVMKANPKGDKNIIVLGDFNCPHINWNFGYTHDNAPDKNVQDKLIDISIENSLSQLQEKPTRGNSILDLTFTTNTSHIRNLNNIPGLSDHEAVIIDSYIKPIFSVQKKKKVFIFSKADWPSLNSYCQNISNSILSRTKDYDINHLWDLFKSSLNLGISQHIPSKFIKKRGTLPWLNKNLEKLMRKKTKLYKYAKQNGDWTKYKIIQKVCRKEFRDAENNYINSTINKGLEENNSKPFWRYIKSQKNDNVGVAPLNEKGKLISESKKKAEILLKQFVSVFTTSSSEDLPPVNKRIDATTSSIKIDPAGVEKLLSKIQPHKACGPDEIPNLVLKTCAKSLAPGVAALFQKSLDTGTLPKDWKDANVTPVFKKGARHAPENYRPVSLTSVLSKVLEHIVCHKLHAHFEEHKVLTNVNHGFRSGFSCETQLTITVDDLARNSDDGYQTDIAILDFSKAFDTVPHHKLLHKLEAYGIRGALHKWISAFLCKRHMRVHVDGESSSETEVLSGVPQGTVLGPLLFKFLMCDVFVVNVRSRSILQ